MDIKEIPLTNLYFIAEAIAKDSKGRFARNDVLEILLELPKRGHIICKYDNPQPTEAQSSE